MAIFFYFFSVFKLARAYQKLRKLEFNNDTSELEDTKSAFHEVACFHGSQGLPFCRT